MIDGVVRSLNGETLRFDHSTTCSDIYQQTLRRSIAVYLAEIRRHLVALDDEIDAEELAGELSVEHVLKEGGQ